MGLFYEFLDDASIKMYGIEAGGLGIERGKHAARFAGGSLGVLQGCKTFVLQDEQGQIEMTHSVSAGLDYAAVGPEHALYHDTGRIEYTYAVDEEALEAFDLLSRLEGIIPALESAHAIAYCLKLAPTLGRDKVVMVNLSGRGDKDVMQVAKIKGVEL
jgi:tryptophan synthase beta chain